MSVIITGMHRSGTSAAARLVDAFGLTAGAGLMMGPAPDNPRGFFERRDVEDFNDAWLRQLGGSWWAPPATAAHTWRHLDGEEVNKARAGFDLFTTERAPWYSKDPRTALLLPLWDRLALRELPLIICLRHPGEVAASLGLRNGLSARRGLALWATYTAAAVNHAGDRPALVLDYAASLEAPTETVALLEDFLHETGHRPGPDWSREHAARLLERPLRRAAAAGWNEELQPHRKHLLELYRHLAKRHGQSLAETGRVVLHEWVEEVLDELRELHASQRTQADAEEQVCALRGEVERLLGEPSASIRHQAELAERNRAVAAAAEETERLRILVATAVQDGARESSAREALERQVDELRAERTGAEAETARLAAAFRAARADLAAQRTSADAERERLEASLRAEGERLAVQRTSAAAESEQLATALRAAREELAARHATAEAESERVAAMLRDAVVACERETERAQLLKAQLRARTEEVTDLGTQLVATRADLAVARADAERLTRDVADVQQAHDHAAAQAAELHTQLQGMQQRADETARRIADEQRARAAERDQLHAARAESNKRRTAMTEMSAELERRRVRAHRAECLVAQLTQRAGELEAAERSARVLTQTLLVARFERDHLRTALEQNVDRRWQAELAFDLVMASHSWRWGRVLTAPARLVRGAGTVPGETLRITAEQARDLVEISQSGIFDAEWYLAAYPDVAAAGVHPLEHFVVMGWKEGRDPGPLFSLRYYLQTNPDVAESNVNPLTHYLTSGWRQGRLPRPDFDHAAYLEEHDLPEGIFPLAHEAARLRVNGARR